MSRYIVRRVIGAIPVLFIISIMIYGILLIAPGGPEARFAQNPKITQDQITAFRKRWGLDQPIPIQYCRWLGVCNPDNDRAGRLHQRQGRAQLPARASWAGATTASFTGTSASRSATAARSATSSASGSCRRRSSPARPGSSGSRSPSWPACTPPSGGTACSTRRSRSSATSAISLPTFWLGIMLLDDLRVDAEDPAGRRHVGRRGTSRSSGRRSTGPSSARTR